MELTNKKGGERAVIIFRRRVVAGYAMGGAGSRIEIRREYLGGDETR